MMWWLLVLTVPALVAARLHQVAFAAHRRTPAKADVIVVLGARVFLGGRASAALEERARRAAQLHASGLGAKVLVSGGAHDDEHTEASVAARLLVELGVPRADVVLEDRARNTFDNARLSAPLLRALGAQSVLVVSDDYHLWRAGRLFRRQGFTPQLVAARQRLSRLAYLRRLAGETLAVMTRPSLWW